MFRALVCSVHVFGGAGGRIWSRTHAAFRGGDGGVRGRGFAPFFHARGRGACCSWLWRLLFSVFSRPFHRCLRKQNWAMVAQRCHGRQSVAPEGARVCGASVACLVVVCTCVWRVGRPVMCGVVWEWHAGVGGSRLGCCSVAVRGLAAACGEFRALCACQEQRAILYARWGACGGGMWATRGGIMWFFLHLRGGCSHTRVYLLRTTPPPCCPNRVSRPPLWRTATPRPSLAVWAAATCVVHNCNPCAGLHRHWMSSHVTTRQMLTKHVIPRSPSVRGTKTPPPHRALTPRERGTSNGAAPTP